MANLEICLHNLPVKDLAAIEKTLYTFKRNPDRLTNEEKDWMDWAEVKLLNQDQFSLA